MAKKKRSNTSKAGQGREANRERVVQQVRQEQIAELPRIRTDQSQQGVHVAEAGVDTGSLLSKRGPVSETRNNRVTQPPRSNGTNTSQKRRRYVRKSWLQRNPWAIIVGALAVAAIVVGSFILIANSRNNGATIGGTNDTVLKQVTSVSQSVSASVNTGDLQNVLTPPPGNAPPLNGANGKPQIFFYGADFCPYCAAERWSLVVALSRFGTFSELPQTTSSSTDTDPNTATFSFHGARYSSSYIDFAPLEAETRDRQPLEQPTAEQQQILTQYQVNGYPFLNIANKYIGKNPVFSPDVLIGLSQKDIASKLTDPSQDVTKNIVGGANYITAAICSATNNQPASACTQEPIPTIQSSLTQKAQAPFDNQLYQPVALARRSSIRTA